MVQVLTEYLKTRIGAPGKAGACCSFGIEVLACILFIGCIIAVVYADDVAMQSGESTVAVHLVHLVRAATYMLIVPPCVLTVWYFFHGIKIEVISLSVLMWGSITAVFYLPSK
jgi:hypothetical protein